MPSYLIVHSQPPGGRADLFAQPPTIDVAGFGARLDWGDVTFEVPPGDHRVAISVAPVAGGREGAVVTVRVLPETGTRLSFSPPATPGQPSTLHVDGQWPADAAMAYYAARDRRELTPVASGQPQQPAYGQQQPPASAPQQPARQPAPSVPPVGPVIGSTGSVPVVAPPSSAPSFGQVQGAVVEPGAQQPHPPAAPPVAPGPAWSAPQPPSFAPPTPQHQRPQPPQVSPWQQHPPPHAQPSQQQAPAQHVPQQPMPAQHQPPQPMPQQPPAQQRRPHAAPPHAFGPGAPQQPPMQQGMQQPAFGHQPIVRRDVYGRDRVDGDRSAPPIPTPRQFQDFARAERERHEAEVVAASRQQQGWYPDPYGRSDVRWHDGERWTPSVMRQGRREHDPI